MSPASVHVRESDALLCLLFRSAAAYFFMLHSIGAVSAGIMKGVRAVAVFVLSATIFCSIDSNQCIVVCLAHVPIWLDVSVVSRCQCLRHEASEVASWWIGYYCLKCKNLHSTPFDGALCIRTARFSTFGTDGIKETIGFSRIPAWSGELKSNNCWSNIDPKISQNQSHST